MTDFRDRFFADRACVFGKFTRKHTPKKLPGRLPGAPSAGRRPGLPRGYPGGSPGTAGFEKRDFSVTFDTNGVAMARHGLRICVYRATAPKKLLNTLRGFRDNVKNLKAVNKKKT